VVHPLNEWKLWDGGDPEAAVLAMALSLAPDEGMLVVFRVDGGSSDGPLDLGPGLKAASLQGQQAQHLPPGLDKVQVSDLPYLIGPGAALGV
jgi:hypothetical protein